MDQGEKLALLKHIDDLEKQVSDLQSELSKVFLELNAIRGIANAAKSYRMANSSIQSLYSREWVIRSMYLLNEAIDSYEKLKNAPRD